MKKEKGHVITGIAPDSIAEELGVEPGDRLISINDREIEDIFDYRYLCDDEELTLLIYSAKEKDYYECEVSKDTDEDLGFEFGPGLMDDYRSCSNKCIFCFIDQMPPGMRDTLYFKDDDARLSFLQGNYITLTNMKQKDIDKVCFYKLSPINISVHTTNPELRCRMLNNRFAGDALKKIGAFCEAGLEINGQIVLCKGVNDGSELDRSLKDLEEYLPNLKSLSVVPVGLTRFREGLYPLEPFEKEDAATVLDQIEKWQRYYKEKYGTNLVYASDEWYLTAGRELPAQSEYEGFPQIENGVGMLRSLTDEFDEACENEYDIYEGSVLMLTGMAAYPVIKKMADKVTEKYSRIKMDVMPVRNDFFGHRITVSGLITGRDILNQIALKYMPDGYQVCDMPEGLNTLQQRELILKSFNERFSDRVKNELPFDLVVIPSSMLRAGEKVFLDDMTVDDLQNALQKDFRIVKSNGEEFFRVLCKNYIPFYEREASYEQTDSSDSRQT